MKEAENTLQVAGWDGSDMTQELSHILLCFNGHSINDADSFDKEEINSALDVAILIYLSADDLNVKRSAFKVAEMLEFLKNGYCGYARLRLDQAISSSLDEINDSFEQEFRDFFKNKFSELGYKYLRTEQTFNTYSGNRLWSEDLKMFAMTNEDNKAAAFLSFAQSFYDHAFDYMDAMVLASNMGEFSTVEEYFNFLIDNEAENKRLMKELISKHYLSVDYIAVDPKINELMTER